MHNKLLLLVSVCVALSTSEPAVSQEAVGYLGVSNKVLHDELIALRGDMHYMNSNWQKEIKSLKIKFESDIGIVTTELKETKLKLESAKRKMKATEDDLKKVQKEQKESAKNMIDALNKLVVESSHNVSSLASNQTDLNTRVEAVAKQQLTSQATQTKLIAKMSRINTTQTDAQTDAQTKIATLTTKQTKINTDIATLNTKQTKMNTDIASLYTKQTNINANVKTLTTKQTNIHTDIASLNTKQTNINANVKTLTTKQTKAHTDIATLNTEQTNINANVKTLTTKQTKILKNIAANTKNAVKLVGGRIPQNLLPGSYATATLEDVQWQAVHLAAGAVCGGSNNNDKNYAYPATGGKSCKETCTKAHYSFTCAGGVRLQAESGKATYFKDIAVQNSGLGCDQKMNTRFDEVAVDKYIYTAYCCCI